MTAKRIKRWAIAAVVPFTVLWFALLAGRPLYDPDEGRYAEIPREILAGGDWVTPHLNGLVYLEKPPLQYWLSALGFAAFGQGEAVARLWTGLFGYLTLWLAFAIALRLWGPTAAVRAFVLLAGSILFVLLGHQLTLDMTLCFWLTGALACFVYAQTSPGARAGRWMAGCWIAMALAVLTKGLVGMLIPAATLAAYMAWQRDFALLRTLNLRAGPALFALVAVPWFVLASAANAGFLQFFFIREHFQRFLTPIEERSEPWWFFVPVLLVGVLPWATRALRALAVDWREPAGAPGLHAVRLLWIWSAFTLVFFSLSNAKLIPYILPALPALALLCARPGQAGEAAHLRAGAILTALFAAGVLAFGSGRLGSAHAIDLASRLRPALQALAASLVAGAVAATWLQRRGRALGALAALCAGWFAAAIALTAGAFVVQDLFSARDVAAATGRAGDDHAPVYSVQNYQQSLPFYLGRTVVLVDYRDEFAFGLRRDPGRGIASLDEFVERWRQSTRGLAVMPRRTRARLESMGAPMREVRCFADDLCLMSREQGQVE